jgi:hypothetical protein
MTIVGSFESKANLDPMLTVAASHAIAGHVRATAHRRGPLLPARGSG